MNSSEIIVAIITTVGVITTTIIQTHHSKKNDDIEASIKDLKEDLKEEKISRCKYDLISVMSRIDKGYVPTPEEKIILKETKDYYNNLGGDSYVDDMYDSLKKEGKL